MLIHITIVENKYKIGIPNTSYLFRTIKSNLYYLAAFNMFNLFIQNTT